jgi:RIO kinase 1
MWALYQRGGLQPDTPLTGHFEQQHAAVDLRAVMREIDDARDEHQARLLRVPAA